LFFCQTEIPQAKYVPEKAPKLFVIPSEARNLSFFSWAWNEERFLASLGMTELGTFSASCKVRATNHPPVAGARKMRYRFERYRRFPL
jgi:hypothetical protein